MLAALALKVKLDGESLEDKFWFDVMLLVLQVGGPLAMIVKQWKDGGVKEIVKGNADVVGAVLKSKESMDEIRREARELKKALSSNSSDSLARSRTSEQLRRLQRLQEALSQGG